MHMEKAIEIIERLVENFPDPYDYTVKGGFGSLRPVHSFDFSTSEGHEISEALQYAIYAIRNNLSDYQKRMNRTDNERKTWSKTEIRCLVEAFLIDGKSISEIAWEHRRSNEAIRTRLNLLGIRVPKTRY